MDKFESILNAFSNGYNPACTAYLELLISHLQKKENSNILQAPYVLKWVLSCLQKLEVDFSCFEPNILAFIIKLSALLTSNEWLVVHLRDEKLLD
uniref:Uncharacterized protein n=1 Tax=Megaselia scalaris TaxID=36166 RepID=T1H4V7_MEGSC